jgi:hypothetical protein
MCHGVLRREKDFCYASVRLRAALVARHHLSSKLGHHCCDCSQPLGT